MTVTVTVKTSIQKIFHTIQCQKYPQLHCSTVALCDTYIQQAMSVTVTVTVITCTVPDSTSPASIADKVLQHLLCKNQSFLYVCFLRSYKSSPTRSCNRKKALV